MKCAVRRGLNATFFITCKGVFINLKSSFDSGKRLNECTSISEFHQNGTTICGPGNDNSEIYTLMLGATIGQWF